MLSTVITLAVLFGFAKSSVEHGAPVFSAPVVTAASSQYFERTFNRLVAAPPPLQPVIPVAQPPPIFVQPAIQPNAIPFGRPVFAAAPPALPTAHPALPAAPTNVPVATNPPQEDQPNIAIAVATANAAAPVATILLPPYPFGPPPIIGFVPPQYPINVPDEKKESTTKHPATKTSVKTTTREPEATTPVPSNSDDNFVQALPSNENVSFKQYGLPFAPPQLARPLPQPQPNRIPNTGYKPRPQKLKTSVEVVPVPLAYIAPPPLYKPTHQAIKIVRHIYAFVPTTNSKIIIRPAHLKIRSVRTPARLVTYQRPLQFRNVARSQEVRPLRSKDVELTTFSPFNRSVTRPPKL